MSTTDVSGRIGADQVFDTLKKSILVDGFHIVIDLEKSHDSVIVDARDGKEYLDFYTYFASLPVGHNHPKMEDEGFRKRLMRAALANPANADIYTVEFAEFVDTFRRIAQRPELPNAFFVAGGGLGVENALKASFDWKVRKNHARGIRGEFGGQMMHLREAFHGRTGYTMSLTNTDPWKVKYFPQFDWPRISNPKCSFPLEGTNLMNVQAAEEMSLKEIECAVAKHGDDIAGLILEPIQGEGGDNHFRAEYFQALRRLADKYEFMLIFDEVQTGVGITGKFWAYEHFGVKPDAIAFGKKMQVCGFLGGPRYKEVEDNVFDMSSRINSTWGGNLVDMVRSQRYLEIIEEDKLVQNAAARGETLVKGLRELESRHEVLHNARGRGLFAAVDLPDGEMRDKTWMQLADHGVLSLKCGPRTIRFRPALNVTDAQIQKGLDVLDSAIKSIV